jgi:hypothetical protein
MEFVADLSTGELMEHRLHHGEFIQISVEQTGDDHGMFTPAKW